MTINKSKTLVNYLIGSTIFSIAVGGIVLGASFDSWEQKNSVNELKKYEDLKDDILLLKNKILDYNKDPEHKNIDEVFIDLLNVIFNGYQDQSSSLSFDGPMWNDWNKKLSIFMSVSINKKNYEDLKLKDAFDKLISYTNTDSELKDQEIKDLINKTKSIEYIFNDLSLITESATGFIIGITILSLTLIPITILISLKIWTKNYVKNDEKNN